MSRKKLATILISVLLSVIAIDCMLNAFVTHYIKNHSLPGDYEKINYIMRECDASFLLIGASQCANFFKVDIMEEELKTDIFNCGVNAQTAEFFDVILDRIVQTHPPKQVLVVLRPADLTSSAKGRLNMLNIYYGIYTPRLDQYLDNDSLYQKIMLKSSLLRINTHWWRILLYHFISFDEMKQKGFIPKPVRNLHPDKKIKIDESISQKVTEIIPQKKAVLDHIVQNCKKHHIKLYFSFIPTLVDYGQAGNPYSRILDNYCKENDVYFLDDSILPEITDRHELFYDEHHLNADGAEIYTKLFVKKYSAILKNN